MDIDYLGLNSKERANIKALKRRCNHLQERINASDRDLSYDKVELRALKWILNLVENYENIK